MYRTKRDFVSYLNLMFPRLDPTMDDTTPRIIADEIHAQFDAMGWKAYEDAVGTIITDTAVNSVLSSAVQAANVRLILGASIETDSADAFHVWIEQRVAAGTTADVALIQPFLVPAGNADMKVGLVRPVLLSPLDRLIGRCSPTLGTSEVLTLRIRSIDINNVGEYIPGL